MNKYNLKNHLGLAMSIILILGLMTVMANPPQNNFKASIDGLNTLLTPFAANNGSLFNQGFFGPTISTAKSSYGPGETIYITGSGFRKFEQVNLVVEQFDSFQNNDVFMGQLNTYADRRGQINTSVNVDSFYSPNGTYTIKAYGASTKFPAETNFDTAILAEAANLDQCANGGVGQPVEPCSGAGWVNGNLNESKSHWFEGQSIAYRMILTGLTPNSTGNTLTFEWDTTKSGLHAIDYITSFDRTETLAMGNNPCSGVTGCNLGTFTTFPIPTDPFVTAGQDQILGNSDDITQVPGVLTLFGGTITGVSAYSRTGTYAGDSETRITVTFSVGADGTAVLAWGGHIASRLNWGDMNSAVFISGSPYHMRLIELNGSGGQQDRSLKASAVQLVGRIVIIKDALPESTQQFDFDASGPSPIVTNFSLVDDGVTVGANTKAFDDLLNFGAYTVFESGLGGYNLTGIQCTSSAGGGPGIPNNVINVQARQVQINLEEGETVTCTFTNSIVTAASATVSGRVTDSLGTPLSRTRVTVFNTNTGETHSVYTGSFGTYRFEGLVVNNFYVVSVENRRYTFNPSTQSFFLSDDLSNADFAAQAP